MADPLRVVVHGASGRMGQEVVAAIGNADSIALAGTFSRSGGGVVANGQGPGTRVADGDGLAALLDAAHPDVIVDFSSRDAVAPLVRTAAARTIHVVTGTSGIAESDQREMDIIAREAGIGVMIGPNFSLGAVLLEDAARRIARHFDYAEIVEMHHAGKADAPSGSALATARAMVSGRDGNAFSHAEPTLQNLEGTRGGEQGGVAIHSVRMPGLMAHQEVIMGGPGETIRLRHDTIDRACYMPGVLLAVRAVKDTVGLTYGLGAVLGLEGDSS